MSKEVKIPVSVPGADKAGQDLRGVSREVEHLGDSASKSGKGGVSQLNEKVAKTDGVLTQAISSIKSYVLAWLSIEGVIRILNKFIERLERIVALQKEAYDRTIALAEVGQRLEMQTGTVGKQQQWGAFARDLQRAGGFANIGAAQDMAIAMDISTASTGGIKNKQNQALAMSIAPMFGAAGMGGDQISKFLELAGSAGVAPTASGYQQAFAQVRAGFTASKATDIGGYISGLQQGGTSFMAQGGSLERAISLYTAARSVTGNEALAGTLLEQMSRLSSGGYERPREALEKFTGKPWASLSMDGRSQALLDYVSSIPASQRTQVMAEQGFPVELASGMAKLAGAEGMASLANATGVVGGASSADVQAMANAYTASPLGVSRRTAAEVPVLGTSPQDQAIQTTQERLRRARNKAQALTMRGMNLPGTGERKEAAILVLQEMLKEAQAAGDTELLSEIYGSFGMRPGGGEPPLSTSLIYPAAAMEQKIAEYQGRLNVHNHYNETTYYPRTGSDGSDPRANMDQ